MAMSVDRRSLAKVSRRAGLVVAAVQGATAVAALRRGRRDYADAAWGPGLAAIAVSSAVSGSGDPWRRWSTAAVATAWAARLSSLMMGRLRDSDEEDPRYTEYLDGDSTPKVVAKVFVTQGLAQLLVSAPVQLAAASTLPRSARRVLFPLGLAVMAGGLVIETIADRQKDAYKARDDEDKPQVLDTGLWGISRHPNYLGDSIVWDGAWVVASASAPGGWTWPAPAAMSYFLMYATGAKRTEQRMQDRPGYRDYQRRVPFFFPRPWN